MSGCNTSTIGLYPSIFATIQGTCDDSGDDSEEDMEAEVEWVHFHYSLDYEIISARSNSEMWKMLLQTVERTFQEG